MGRRTEIVVTIIISAIGLDVGSKRIGVAGCDGLGLLAIGLGTIERQSLEGDIALIGELITERRATQVIIGLPYKLDGTLGTQAKQVQKFGRRLGKTLQISVEYVDERLTSIAAEADMIAAGISLRDHKGEIDRRAAAIILQQWLDARREQRSP
jgi:putative holliday junction resolvase